MIKYYYIITKQYTSDKVGSWFKFLAKLYNMHLLLILNISDA